MTQAAGAEEARTRYAARAGSASQGRPADISWRTALQEQAGQPRESLPHTLIDRCRLCSAGERRTMPELMMSAVVLAAEINRITSTAGGSARELVGLWDPLREILPFSAAWLGVLDTRGRRFLTAAAVGHDPMARAYLESRAYFAEVESSGMLRRCRPMCLRNGGRASAGPSSDGPWWPAGQHDGLGVSLIAADGRPVGLLILLTDATGHFSETGCQVI